MVALLAAVTACGEKAITFREVAPAPRRLVVWLENGGLDADTSVLLQAAGVDEIVLRRGSLDLAGQAPLLRIEPVGEVVA